MKKTLTVIGFLCFSAIAVLFATAQDAPGEGMLIHVTHGTDDPHRLLMALNMADMMAKDHEVLVYLDIHAVDAVLKDSPDIAFAQFPSSKTLLRSLLDKKVGLMVCPGCLQAAGKTPEDLAPGMQIAEKARFFTFAKGRIVTLDY